MRARLIDRAIYNLNCELCGQPIKADPQLGQLYPVRLCLRCLSTRQKSEARQRGTESQGKGH